MNVPLARFLTRFPVDGVAPQVALVETPVAPPAPEVRMSAEDYEAALAAVRREVEAACEDRLAALAASHEAALESTLVRVRAEWCAAEGETLGARLDAAIDGLETRLADKVAEALRPLLADAVVARAQAALTETLDLALADRSRRSIVFRGPADLVAAVRAARPHAEGIEFVGVDGADATIIADGLHIETRLAEAFAMLTRTEI